MRITRREALATASLCLVSSAAGCFGEEDDESALIVEYPGCWDGEFRSAGDGVTVSLLGTDDRSYEGDTFRMNIAGEVSSADTVAAYATIVSSDACDRGQTDQSLETRLKIDGETVDKDTADATGETATVEYKPD